MLFSKAMRTRLCLDMGLISAHRNSSTSVPRDHSERELLLSSLLLHTSSACAQLPQPTAHTHRAT